MKPNRARFVGDVAVQTVEDPEFLESRGRVNPCAVWELEAGGGVWLKQKWVGASGKVTLQREKTHGKIK